MADMRLIVAGAGGRMGRALTRVISETPGAVRTPSPTLGEHTEEVLRGVLEVPAAEIAALRAAGVIR